MLALFYHIRSKKARIFHLFSNCCISTTHEVSNRNRKKVAKRKGFKKKGGDSYAIVHTFNCNRPDTRLILTRFDKMLRNEKYVGDVLLQKTFVADLLFGKQVKNQDELERFLIQEHHPAIVSRGLYKRVNPDYILNQYIKSIMIVTVTSVDFCFSPNDFAEAKLN